ncbi:MAG: hypothetical protein ACK5U8_24170 [Deltaproteobacteria bacterium]
MNDRREPENPANELAAINPVRSMAAVSLTFLLFTQVLSRVGATALAVLVPGAFPAQPDESTLVVPGTAGLVAMLGMTALNAALSGLLAGRIGRAMRLWHGVALGAILGMFAAISMDSLRGFPGWFAVGYLLAPIVGASTGGWLASRVRQAPSPGRAQVVVEDRSSTRSVEK